MAEYRAKTAEAAKIELAATSATVLRDDISGKIIQEKLTTFTRIKQLTKEGFGADVTGPIIGASNLRIRALKSQRAFQLFDIAEGFFNAQVNRPGMGLTPSEQAGAPLFGRQRTIGAKMKTTPNAMERAQLGVEALGIRNQIESGEMEQYIKQTGFTGGQAGGGRHGTTVSQDEAIQARLEKQIMTAIRSNPALKAQLDKAMGSGLTTKNLTSGPADIGGGRTLNDIYNLVDQKWQ